MVLIRGRQPDRKSQGFYWNQMQPKNEGMNCIATIKILDLFNRIVFIIIIVHYEHLIIISSSYIIS